MPSSRRCLVHALALLLLAAAGCTTRDASRCAVGVYEVVEVPIHALEPVPAYRIRFVPQYETVMEPIRRQVRVPVTVDRKDPRTGRVCRVARDTEVVEREVGTRACRRFAGYEPKEVQIGWRSKKVETGTRKVRVFRGWRYADDPPWPCEAAEGSSP